MELPTGCEFAVSVVVVAPETCSAHWHARTEASGLDFVSPVHTAAVRSFPAGHEARQSSHPQQCFRLAGLSANGAARYAPLDVVLGCALASTVVDVGASCGVAMSACGTRLAPVSFIRIHACLGHSFVGSGDESGGASALPAASCGADAIPPHGARRIARECELAPDRVGDCFSFCLLFCSMHFPRYSLFPISVSGNSAVPRGHDGRRSSFFCSVFRRFKTQKPSVCSGLRPSSVCVNLIGSAFVDTR
jgi:hypothetical protein